MKVSIVLPLGNKQTSVPWLLVLGLVTSGQTAEPQHFQPLVTIAVDDDGRTPPTPVRGVAFSPAASQLAAACYDRAFKLFDLPSGDLVAKIEPNDQPAFCLTFSPDGKLLACGGWDVLLWDVAARRGAPFGGRSTWVHALAFSPDGRMLAFGDYRSDYKLWSLPANMLRYRFDPFLEVGPVDTGLYNPTTYSFSFSPDGRLLAAHSDFFDEELGQFDQVQLWDISTGKLIKAFRGAYPEFAPDGLFLVYAIDGKIRKMAVATHEVVTAVDGLGTRFRLARHSPSEGLLALVGLDHTIRLWDVRLELEVVALAGHRDEIFAIAFSRDGNQLASGSRDGTIRIWSKPGSR